MAGGNRTVSPFIDLYRRLHEEPYKFDFFQALRRLECLHKDKPRLGESQRPEDEPVRISQIPSLAFAPSTLAAFDAGEDGKAARLAVLFLGLFGPNGALPLHLTEYACERRDTFNDPTFIRFLDMFHHRMLTLFYRAWASAEPTVHFDRPQSDRFAYYVGSLVGLGMPAMRNRDAMPDLAKLHYSGWFSCQNRPAEGLSAILTSFFKLPIQIKQFIAHWLQLPMNCCWRLGSSPETGSLGRRGKETILGLRVWDCQHKFRMIVGPVSLEDYRQFLPGEEPLKRLVAIVRNYIGDQLDWDLNLILKKDEVPEMQLGEHGQLGWTTWLGERRSEKDADDLVLKPLTCTW